MPYKHETKLIPTKLKKSAMTKNKLDTNDYQLLATLAHSAGFEELRLKCIAYMFKDMKVIKKD